VCIVLIFNRKKRFWWIPASFAAILILTSIGPWSYNNIVKRSFRAYVRESLLQPQVKKALSSDPVIFANTDSAAVMPVIEKTKYLYDNYDKAVIADLADSLTINRILNYISEYGEHAYYSYCHEANSNAVKISGRYSRIAVIDTTFTMKSMSSDTFKVNLKYTDSGKKASLPIVFQIKKMISISKDSSTGDIMQIQAGESCLFLKSFRMSSNGNQPSLAVEGILLLK